jgi:hypothetical protein
MRLALGLLCSDYPPPMFLHLLDQHLRFCKPFLTMPRLLERLLVELPLCLCMLLSLLPLFLIFCQPIFLRAPLLTSGP